jgi:hypothetical protein
MTYKYNNLSHNDTVAIEMMENLEYDAEQSEALYAIEEAIGNAVGLFDMDTFEIEIENIMSKARAKRTVQNIAFPFDKLFSDLLRSKTWKVK